MRSIVLAALLCAVVTPAAPARAAQPQIVYESWWNGNPDVWIMNADGSNQRALTTDPSRDQGPVWSPDGSRIAFMSDRDGDTEIFTMAADGTDVIQLTRNAAFDMYPVWGPTGRIAFISTRNVSNGTTEIWTMNRDGSGLARLTSNDGSDAYPAWTPDGRILFASAPNLRAGVSLGAQQEIYRMNADGSGVVRLTDNTCTDLAPSSSPDGTMIAFASDCGRASIGVTVMTADGSGVRALSTNAGTENWPTWSPDGTKIVYASNAADPVGGGDIMVMNADGSAPRNLSRTPDGFEGLPWFSPHGSFDEIGRGHIAVGNPMGDTRTVTVLGASAERAGAPGPDQGIDGFFLPAPPSGTSIGTETTDHGGAGYALNLNFHDAAGAWLGKCDVGWFIGGGVPRLEVRTCIVPARAATVEVSADFGIDLDVIVRAEPF